jgi:hypothetical protein
MRPGLSKSRETGQAASTRRELHNELLAESNCGCSQHRWRREAILSPPFFVCVDILPSVKEGDSYESG